MLHGSSRQYSDMSRMRQRRHEHGKIISDCRRASYTSVKLACDSRKRGHPRMRLACPKSVCWCSDTSSVKNSFLASCTDRMLGIVHLKGACVARRLVRASERRTWHETVRRSVYAMFSIVSKSPPCRFFVSACPRPKPEPPVPFEMMNKSEVVHHS